MQNCLPEWTSPTWITSLTDGSALIVPMNAGLFSYSVVSAA
ncbi:MAG: hypothetical protein ACXVQU_12295 [Actinomycetota bacterium]